MSTPNIYVQETSLINHLAFRLAYLTGSYCISHLSVSEGVKQLTSVSEGRKTSQVFLRHLILFPQFRKLVFGRPHDLVDSREPQHFAITSSTAMEPQSPNKCPYSQH